MCPALLKYISRFGEVIKENRPELLQFEFNYDKKLESLKNAPLPWRIKNALGWLN